jgi:glycosyltransferase involved in cell wall biosynthesis
MEMIVCGLSRELRAREHASFVFCTDSEGALFGKAPADDKVCGQRKAAPFLLDLRVVWRLVRFAGAHSVDVFHAHNHVAHFYSVAASLFDGIPVIVTFHGQGRDDTAKTLRLRKWLSFRTRMAVAVSQDAMEILLAGRCFPAGKVRMIRNGVGIKAEGGRRKAEEGKKGEERRAGAREEFMRKLGIPSNAFVIGSVGRFAPEKNYALLMRAFSLFVSHVKKSGTTLMPPHSDTPILPYSFPSTLLLVGDGPERKALEALAVELGIHDMVIMPGMQDDVMPWMRCMDVFCLSSTTEGTSLTLLESSACGVPAVVTSVGGNTEVVEDGVTGIVVPPGDPEAMASALDKLRVNQELRGQMGAQARKRIERFYSIQSMAEQYEAIYREVVTKIEDEGRGREGREVNQ